MKRQPLILAFALLLMVSAALWVVHYRRNHPPLSREDKELRAVIGNADRIGIYQWSCPLGGCSHNALVELQMLDATQTQELIEVLRLGAVAPHSPDQPTTALELHFWRRGKTLGTLTLYQDRSSTWIQQRGAAAFPKLHPVYEKRLRRYLDEVAPRRKQPQ